MHAAGRRCPDRPASSYQTRRGQPGIHREFGLAEDEVPVMLLSVGPERPGNWVQKPRLPVADVLELV